MLFRKLREERYINRNVKKSLTDLEREIACFDGIGVIAVCPGTTGNSWQGVLSATEGLFEERVFRLPQYFSNPVYSENELLAISEFLLSNNSEHIVFSGYLPYFDTIIQYLSKKGKKVSIIYHGSHTTVLEDPNAAYHFQRMSQLLKRGILYKVGFVKKDMHKSFKKLTQTEYYPIILKTDESILSLSANQYDGLNIGVLTHDGFRKNIYNMISAALMHEEARVHVKDRYLSFYMDNQERLIEHKMKADREDFLKIMGGMTINYYVTFSECWGQFVNESLAMGVPCLTSDVSSVLDFDPELKKLLVVNEFDNDHAIYMKSSEIIENTDIFRKWGPEYVMKVNQIAKDHLGWFVE
jgi:glycosyltransferase involved in cell wall biosynthesis